MEKNLENMFSKLKSQSNLELFNDAELFSRITTSHTTMGESEREWRRRCPWSIGFIKYIPSKQKCRYKYRVPDK